MKQSIPEKKISTGLVNATIWLNQYKDEQDQPVSFRSVSFERRYVDKKGTWKSTNSLRINDLPRASLVLNKAYEFILLRDKPIAAASSYEEDVDEEEIY